MENKDYYKEADRIFKNDEEVEKLVTIFDASPKMSLAMRMSFNQGYEKAHNILDENNNRFYKKLDKIDPEFLISNIEDMHNLAEYLNKNYADKDIKSKLVQIMAELSNYLISIFNSNNN